jgi:hypothetical protein
MGRNMNPAELASPGCTTDQHDVDAELEWTALS